jgi:hypothetical protein
MAGDKKLPLGEIVSSSRFVLFCKAEGVVSEHTKPAEAMHALRKHLQENPKSGCRIYERASDGWNLML